MALHPPGELAAAVNSAGFFRTHAGWKLDALRTRAWPDLDLWALVSGRATAQTPEGTVELAAGSCLLMRGGEPYTIVRTSPEPLVHYFVHFDYTDRTNGHRVPHSQVMLPPLSRHLRRGTLLFDLLSRLVGAYACGDLLAANHWLAVILLELAAHDERVQGAPKLDGPSVWIEQLCAQILEFPESNHSVVAMAKRLGYHEAHFSRVFKKHVGRSPKQFITNVRMSAARSLLRESGMSVEAVANAVGYRDTHFFSRHFRTATGITPSACRQQMMHVHTTSMARGGTLSKNSST